VKYFAVENGQRKLCSSTTFKRDCEIWGFRNDEDLGHGHLIVFHDTNILEDHAISNFRVKW